MQNDEFDHALIAYSNAEKISGTTPAILGLKATALYYQAGQNITPQIQQIMDEALKQDKHEISVMTLLATEAFKNHEAEKATMVTGSVKQAQRSAPAESDVAL